MRIGFNEVLVSNRADGARQREFNLMPALLRILHDAGHEAVLYFAKDAEQRNVDAIIGGAQVHRVISTPIPSMPTSSRILAGIRYFRQAARSDGLDLFQTNYLPVIPIGVPIFLTVHDIRFVHYPKTYTRGRLQFLRLVYPWSLRQTTRTVAVSENTKQDLMRVFDMPESRIVVVPNPTNPDFHQVTDVSTLEEIRARYNLPQQYVLAVGKIEPRKNLERLVQAYCLLLGRLHDAPDLVILGKEYFGHEEVMRSAATSGHRGRIHFTGFVEEEHLGAAYSLASLFVFPSLHEGFGLPILEAMACGVPVVTSNTSAMPEVAGEAARLVDPWSVESIAEGMHELLTDQERRQTLIRAGYLRTEHFSPEASAIRLLAAYENALRRP